MGWTDHQMTTAETVGFFVFAGIVFGALAVVAYWARRGNRPRL